MTLVNPATNETQETQTNPAGEYVFSLVRPATYNISAEFKGFKRVVRENVVLQVAEKIRVDFILLPGTVTQTVEVRGASPLLRPSDLFHWVGNCRIHDPGAATRRPQCL